MPDGLCSLNHTDSVTLSHSVNPGFVGPWGQAKKAAGVKPGSDVFRLALGQCQRALRGLAFVFSASSSSAGSGNAALNASAILPFAAIISLPAPR